MSTIWDARMNLSALSARGAVRSAQGSLHFDQRFGFSMHRRHGGFVAGRKTATSFLRRCGGCLLAVSAADTAVHFCALVCFDKSREGNILWALLVRGRKEL